MEQLMTRHDTEVGEGEFDSVRWLYETVLREPDPQEADSAVVYGNEDSPDKIEFYSLESPTITDTPIRVWTKENV
jgi:hypothetical protein